ncbi:MAG: hypothetical protein QM704_25430 [Anaeromyxobacteraceae bacterium]
MTTKEFDDLVAAVKASVAAGNSPEAAWAAALASVNPQFSQPEALASAKFRVLVAAGATAPQADGISTSRLNEEIAPFYARQLSGGSDAATAWNATKAKFLASFTDAALEGRKAAILARAADYPVTA